MKKKIIMNEQLRSCECDHLYWIDALKGLGIITVVLGHMAITKPLSVWIYSFHMPMFFMISGFLYEKHRETDWRKFVKKR